MLFRQDTSFVTNIAKSSVVVNAGLAGVLAAFSLRESVRVLSLALCDQAIDDQSPYLQGFCGYAAFIIGIVTYVIYDKPPTHYVLQKAQSEDAVRPCRQKQYPLNPWSLIANSLGLLLAGLGLTGLGVGLQNLRLFISSIVLTLTVMLYLVCVSQDLLPPGQSFAWDYKLLPTLRAMEGPNGPMASSPR